jgi:hypothetical protein
MPLLDAKKRHEEEREIMIHPPQTRLIESAGRAHSALVFEVQGLRLNSCDEKKHGCRCLSKENQEYKSYPGKSKASF